MPISDLPVSVRASPSHLELEAREEGHERHGQMLLIDEERLSSAQPLSSILVLLYCLCSSQEPCRRSCHPSSMICRGQRIAGEGTKGILLPGCSRQVLMQLKLLWKNNLYGGIIKRLAAVCFIGKKKRITKSQRKFTVWGAWQCLQIPIHAILLQPNINSAFLLTILHSCLGAYPTVIH